MSSCPEYKSFVDRRGDLDSIQRANLDDHIKSCGECAAYKADADRTLQLLRALQKHVTPAHSANQAFDRLTARIAASKRQMVMGLVLIATCIAAPFALLLSGDLSPQAWVPFAAALGVAAVGVWLIRRMQASMLRLADREGSFYETWRRDLERGIRMLTAGGVLAIVSCAGFLSVSVLGPVGVVERLVVLGAALLTAFAALQTFIVELPQLRGELRLVRDSSGH